MKRTWFLALLILAAAVALIGAANADVMAGYTIEWWTVDGGAGSSTGGGYSLAGTLGQPDAGASTGGTYTLAGGFWGAGVAAQDTPYSIFLPLIIR